MGPGIEIQVMQEPPGVKSLGSMQQFPLNFQATVSNAPSVKFSHAKNPRWKLYKLEFLHFKFCTKILYAICSVFLRICAGNNSKHPLFLMISYWEPYIICSLIFKRWHRFRRARICRFIFAPTRNIPPPPGIRPDNGPGKRPAGRLSGWRFGRPASRPATYALSGIRRRPYPAYSDELHRRGPLALPLPCVPSITPLPPGTATLCISPATLQPKKTVSF